LARTHTGMAIAILAGIARNTKAAAAARVAAANCLLERGWGKSLQPVGGADGENEIQITIRKIIDSTADAPADPDTDPNANTP
jgi:hypothetical protein